MLSRRLRKSSCESLAMMLARSELNSAFKAATSFKSSVSKFWASRTSSSKRWNGGDGAGGGDAEAADRADPLPLRELALPESALELAEAGRCDEEEAGRADLACSSATRRPYSENNAKCCNNGKFTLQNNVRVSVTNL